MKYAAQLVESIHCNFDLTAKYYTLRSLEVRRSARERNVLTNSVQAGQLLRFIQDHVTSC